MATANPTSPTFTSVLAPVVTTNGNNGTVTTLDLKTKFGAWFFPRIGRRAATALTRSGYIMVRSSDNDTTVLPQFGLDAVSIITAAISNTVSSGGSSGSNTVTLTSATSFAVGDTICLHSDDANANRVEWARIVSISSNTLTVEENFRTSHNANDRVTTQGEIWRTWLPGGDIYQIRTINNSGQDLVFAADAIVYASDTIA